MKYRPKHLVEYALLRTLLALFAVLPQRLALAVGWFFAAVAFHILRFRVTEAVARIRQVLGPETSESEARRIAGRSMRNFCFNIVELMRIRKMNPAWVDRYIDTTSVRDWLETHDKAEAGVFALVHMGNWDLGGVVATRYDLPVFAIARTQSNPLADQLLNRMRQWSGIDVVAREDPALLRGVLRRLKEKKLLAILMDLRSATPGLDVEYLGHRANLAGGMALFARQARVPVYPFVITREGWQHHVLKIHSPILPDPAVDKAADWQRMTQEVMRVLGDAVMARPDQYFWFNKRWVLQPLDE